MKIPSNEEFQAAITVLRTKDLQDRIAQEGIDITKISPQNFDKLMNIATRIERVHAEFNRESQQLQAAFDAEVKRRTDEATANNTRRVNEANAKIADDVAKHNEILSQYRTTLQVELAPTVQTSAEETVVRDMREPHEIPFVEATLDNPEKQ